MSGASVDQKKDAFIGSIFEIEHLYKDFPKALRIRIERWVEKLVNSGSNPAFTTHRNAYTKLLLSMVRQSRFSEPFHKMPPDGRLAPFPTHLKSKLRPVEAPIAVQGGSQDGFWGDMRTRAGLQDSQQVSSTGGQPGYNHQNPVAHSTEEQAAQSLERAHSNSLSQRPPKMSTSPLVSPQRTAARAGNVSRSNSNIEHSQQYDHRSRVNHGTSPAPAHELHRAFHPHAWGANHRVPSGEESHASGVHHTSHPTSYIVHTDHNKLSSGAVHGDHDHEEMLSHSAEREEYHPKPISRHHNQNGHPYGTDLPQHHSHAPHPPAAPLDEKYAVANAHVLPTEVALLQMMVREQSVRIKVLEEQLAEERMNHTLDKQHLEFKYLSELTRLREAEAQMLRDKEASKTEVTADASLVAEYLQRSLVRQNSYGSVMTALNTSVEEDCSNLDYGREYNSIDFDRAYAANSNNSHARSDAVASGAIGTAKGAEKPLYPGSPFREPQSKAGKHHLIHISSPPPRLPGRTSPIFEAGAGHVGRTSNNKNGTQDFPVIPFPSASMIAQRWADESYAAVGNSADFSRLDFKAGPPSSRSRVNQGLSPRQPSFMRDSVDAEDDEFLTYLAAFQEDLRLPV